MPGLELVDRHAVGPEDAELEQLVGHTGQHGGRGVERVARRRHEQPDRGRRLRAVGPTGGGIGRAGRIVAGVLVVARARVARRPVVVAVAVAGVLPGVPAPVGVP